MRSLMFFQLATLTALTALGAPALAGGAHKPAAAAAATAPAALQVANSDVPGTVKLTWQPVKGATEYIVASSRETEASWQSVAVTTAPAYEFVDLPTGTKYFFRVACNTKAGQGPWSTTVVITTTTTKGPMAALPAPVTLTASAQTPGR